MTTLRSFTRRFRASLSRVLWHWTRPARRRLPQIEAPDPLITQATKAHKPRRHIEAEKTRLAHEALRRGIAQ